MSLRTRLQSLRRRGERAVARLQGEALSLAAEIPGRNGPLWQMRLEMKAEPEAGGERLRLRAHFKLSLRRPALTAAPPAAAGLPARLGQWLEQRLDSPLVQALAEPLLDRDVSTWVELNASTAPLDAGSRALLPERLDRLGIQPRENEVLETWAGEVPGDKPGFAAMSLLRLDKRRLPPEMQKALGEQPFQLAAAVVSVVEDAG